MSRLLWLILIVLLVGAGVVIWFITPVWACPICHSYRVKEHGNDHLSCESCGHSWRML